MRFALTCRCLLWMERWLAVGHKGLDMKWLKSLFKRLHAAFSVGSFPSGIDTHAWETKTEIWRSLSHH